MAFLNLDLNYFEHIKTVRLTAILGVPDAPIYPIKLWSYCGRHPNLNGVLRGYGEPEIEAICGWNGPAGRLIEAMQSIGFLVKVRKTFRVNDWSEINGHILALSERGKAANAVRWSNYRRTKESSKSDANAIHKDNLRNPPSIPSIPSITTDNGEKRFQPPTIEELKAYATEISYIGFDPDRFIEYYSKRNWTQKSGKPVTRWKGCVNTWKRSDEKKAGNLNRLGSMAHQTIKDIE